MKNIIILARVLLMLFLCAFRIGAHAQNITVNAYNNETEFSSRGSVTLTDGFYIPAGKSVRIFISGPTFKNCTPNFVGVPSPNQNYISTKIFKQAGVSLTNLENLRSVCDVNQTINYFDGLGRPIQSIQSQASPNFKDIVQPVDYDKNNRESIKYLPYAAEVGDGNYKIDVLSKQAAFYGSGSWDTHVTPNAKPFSQTVFEASPLNRIKEQGAPGLLWQPAADRTSTTGRTSISESGSNVATDAVKLWVVTSSGANAVNSFYPVQVLHKTTIKDENWITTDGKAGTIEEFKDLDGHVVLKRLWETNLKSLSTYYIYDDLGNLRYVLPPAVNENSEYVSNSIDNFSESDQIFKQFMYGYHYDGRKRIIRKKLPGKGWDYMVYNKLDQVVLSQDSVQRNAHQWVFNKYDAFGRMVSSGIYTKDSSLEGLQAIVNSQTQLWEIRLGTEYDGSSFPQQDIEIQLVNYYDNYNVSGIPDNRSTSYSSKLKGLATANKVKVLGANDFLWTVSYYDDEARVVQIYKQHYLGGQVNALNYDDIANKYSFVGELTESIRMHHAGSNVTKIANRYEYDHVGRKLASFEAINDGTEVALNKSDYNEIGQLIKKSLHSTDGTSFVQSNTYRYNERGWLSKINDPDQLNSANIFGMELLYGNKEDAFNGNIGGMRWKAKVPPGQGLTAGLQSFAYDYDKLNRLKNAKYTTPGAIDQFNEELQYDIMGNISHLKRKNNASGYLNDFTYDYLSNGIGNKLWKVSDAGTAGQTSNYTYDANGNLKTDSFKGININYNMLNLPGTITKSGESLNYVYDASGQKLRKVYNGMARDYVSGIEYNNGVLEFIQTEEGRALPGAVYSYEYLLKDHLGNTRAAINQTGEIIQVQDYYAFGMEMGNSKSPSPKNQYKYNGKEMQDELGLNHLDYGARFYDPIIGRWNVVDPSSENYGSTSPYNYVLGYPMKRIDSDGRDAIFTVLRDKNNEIVGLNVSATVYITGAGASEKRADELDSYAKTVLKPKSVDGVNVSFKLDFQYSDNKTINDLQRGENLLTFNAEPEDDNKNGSGKISHVSPPNLMSAANNGIIYSSGINSFTVLHESIHLLGLNDRYMTTNMSLSGPRTASPQSGYENDIMGGFKKTGFSDRYYQYFLNKASSVMSSSDKFYYHPIFNLMRNQRVISFPNDERVDVNPDGTQKDFRYPKK
jgi:RHS repeat-associated protein